MKLIIERNKKPRKKRQFSKCWLVICIVLSIIFPAASYIIAALDKNPVSELSIEILKILWFATYTSAIGYYMQNCVRAYTASKFGIPKEDKDEHS